MKSAPQRSDARRAPRHPVDTRLDVSVTTSAVTTRVRGRSLDISTSGMGCVLADELTPGQAVTAEFSLPLCPDRLRVNATVKHIRGSRHGFEFTNMPERTRQQLHQVCEALPKLGKV